MTDNELISLVSNEFQLSRSDVTTLLDIVINGYAFEITGLDEEKIALAYHKLSDLAPSLSEGLFSLPEDNADISDVISRINEKSPGFSIHEHGLDLDGTPSQEQFEGLMLRLYGARARVHRLKVMLDWAIADACLLYKQRFGSLTDITIKLGTIFHVSPATIKQSVKIASLVPKEQRAWAWSWWHYRPVILHAQELRNRPELFNKLTEGKEKTHRLSNGTVVKSIRPLSPTKISRMLVETLRVKKKKRKKRPLRYIYILPSKTYASDTLFEDALSISLVSVIDTQTASVLRKGKHPEQLAEYDPSVLDFYQKVLGRRPSS